MWVKRVGLMGFGDLEPANRDRGTGALLSLLSWLTSRTEERMVWPKSNE